MVGRAERYNKNKALEKVPNNRPVSTLNNKLIRNVLPAVNISRSKTKSLS